MKDQIARYYRADKNEAGAAFPGVPLRDLTDAEFEALPEHLQRDVDASELYQKTKPKPRAQVLDVTPTPDAAPSDADKEAS